MRPIAQLDCTVDTMAAVNLALELPPTAFELILGDPQLCTRE